jgi:hypothetical protein
VSKKDARPTLNGVPWSATITLDDDFDVVQSRVDGWIEDGQIEPEDVEYFDDEILWWLDDEVLNFTASR